MFRRIESIVREGFNPDLDEFLQNAYRERDKALEVGFASDRFEGHVYSYLEFLEIGRHQYFLSERLRRKVSMEEACDSFYDEGYVIGLSDHWQKNVKFTHRLAKTILGAKNFEIVHAKIGEYDRITLAGVRIPREKAQDTYLEHAVGF